eukprot:m.446348 g.446348  ORF g.446348 m.446348 type:complete len:449 (-) comp19349_c0_seq1:1286-2632(-)
MKVKVLSRSKERYTRSTKDDIHPVAVNVDPKLHPFEAPREYQRALNATKLERAFAKPFVGALDGHKDGVFCMAKHPHRLSWMLSGACDGEVKLWDLATQECIHSAELHQGFVQGLCTTPSGRHFISVGQDKTIRIARLDDEHIAAPAAEKEEAIELVSKTFFTGVDHHRRQDLFATSGPVVDLWSTARSEPVTSFSWGADTVTTVKFNPVEVNVLATAADDRNIALYDARAATPIRKLVMAMRTNALCWNPMEAFNFTVANEDHNLYTFDMRKLKTALNVHKDHVSAVLDVDYSPTGREFVTGSYDRTVRIFEYNRGRSREVYHTKRMQRIFAVKFSSDAKYVLSGSDEMSIRLWKAKASEHIGPKSARFMAAEKYDASLKERFKHHPEVKRIARHRRTPKDVYSAKRVKLTMESAAKTRAENAIKHKSVKTAARPSERKKHIVEEVE